MSVNASTWSQITNSPLNLSKSKQCYSIPRASRFTKNPQNNCAQAFYNLPPTIEKRAAALGYGTKYDFTKVGVKTPAPNNYTLSTNFIDKNRGKSFGVSRDRMEQFSIMGNIKKGAPGPGAYDIKSAKNSVAYSIRARTNLFANTSTLKVPGPGQYNNLSSITTNGKFFLSNYKDSKAPVINPARSARFNNAPTKGHQIPGPGYYNPNVSITPDGRYFVSSFKDSKCRSFSHAYRKDITSEINKTPGPGAYILPSEFGHYEKADKPESKVNQSMGEVKTEKNS